MTKLTHRSGFTLIEMLVVMTLILALAALGVMMLPSWEKSERVSNGAAGLQSWFTMARQRALLDRSGRGLRLMQDPDNANFYSRAQFIEQPDDYIIGEITSAMVSNNTTTVNFSNDVNLNQNQVVQAGDFLQVHRTGLMHQIMSVNSPQQCTLKSPIVNNIGSSTPYRIVRKPRPSGEEILEMPYLVGIDMKTNVTNNKAPQPSGNSIDIMFSPSGTVSNRSEEKLYFWVREMASADPLKGEPTLIVVYTRTGLVASYAVDVANSNPYVFVE